MSQRHSSIAFALLALTAQAALADPVAAAPYSQIDPNTFIVGHPASPRWKTVHSNGEHPAVLVARRVEQVAAIDPNTFIVQPPASVRWLASGETAVLTVAAAPR